MAFIVLPGFILDRQYFHSAGLKMVQPKPAEGAELALPFLALQVNEFHGQELFTNVIRGGSDQETNNDFIELLTQLAAIDGQNPAIAGSVLPGAPKVQGGPKSEA